MQHVSRVQEYVCIYLLAWPESLQMSNILSGLSQSTSDTALAGLDCFALGLGKELMPTNCGTCVIVRLWTASKTCVAKAALPLLRLPSNCPCIAEIALTLPLPC